MKLDIDNIVINEDDGSTNLPILFQYNDYGKDNQYIDTAELNGQKYLHTIAKNCTNKFRVQAVVTAIQFSLKATVTLVIPSSLKPLVNYDWITGDWFTIGEFWCPFGASDYNNGDYVKGYRFTFGIHKYNNKLVFGGDCTNRALNEDNSEKYTYAQSFEDLTINKLEIPYDIPVIIDYNINLGSEGNIVVNITNTNTNERTNVINYGGFVGNPDTELIERYINNAAIIKMYGSKNILDYMKSQNSDIELYWKDVNITSIRDVKDVVTDAKVYKVTNNINEPVIFPNGSTVINNGGRFKKGAILINSSLCNFDNNALKNINGIYYINKSIVININNNIVPNGKYLYIGKLRIGNIPNNIQYNANDSNIQIAGDGFLNTSARYIDWCVGSYNVGNNSSNIFVKASTENSYVDVYIKSLDRVTIIISNSANLFIPPDGSLEDNIHDNLPDDAENVIIAPKIIPSLNKLDDSVGYKGACALDNRDNKVKWYNNNKWVAFSSQDDVDSLTKVVYTNHIYANFSATPSVIYKGTDTEITFSYSGGISGSTVTPTYAFKKNDAAFTMPASKKETLNTTSAVKYHVDVSAGGVTKGADVTVNAYYPYYTFGSTKDSGYTAADITGGTKQPARWSPSGATHSIVTPANGYFVIAYADGSVSGATIGGFNAPLTKVDDVTINNVTYHIYRCAKPQTAGTYSVTFK